ncbi:DUF3306 domain-containing protein [Pseudomonadota bacterium AL_CKDN230030165-1A_HGKHYDSX7]
MSDTPPSGFLQRWSRRKIEARQEAARPDADVAATDVAPQSADGNAVAANAVAASAVAANAVAATAVPGSSTPSPAAPPDAREALHAPAGDTDAPALPTLDDVRALTADSDYSAFVAREVSPEVKNAALKKLFTDPHYNVMDGLDIYIDDYSQQAPLPESMLRKMAVSKVFGFFEDEARCAADALLNEPASDGARPNASALPATGDVSLPTAVGTPAQADAEPHTRAGKDPQDCDPAAAEVQETKH